MSLDERTERLITMYLKYRETGQRIQATRTLARIKEVGGYAAWGEAIRRDEDRFKDKV